jgi:uncharacterized SAM-binding protein YcdF (DUF218 family)
VSPAKAVRGWLHVADRLENLACESPDVLPYDEAVRMQRIAGYAGALLFFGLALFVVTMAADFQRRLSANAVVGRLPATAIVFTGEFGRIRVGLGLLDKGAIERLFVSGVNRGAGIFREHFADQFALSDGLRAALSHGRIILGSKAQTTLQNGSETACRLGRRAREIRLLLITSRRHLPRASLVLERLIPASRIERLATLDAVEMQTLKGLVVEFGKFVATWLITLLPTAYWPVVGVCP